MQTLFDNPFARFAIHLYSQEPLANLCLRLQDDYGLDVNVLLWMAWLDQLSVPLSERHLLLAERKVRPYQAILIRPLRAVRRRSRPWPVLYRWLKRCELWAEAKEMQVLYRVSSRLTSKADLGAEAGNVRRYLIYRGCEKEFGNWKAVLEGSAGRNSIH